VIDHADIIGADIDFILSCSVENVLDSGWPVFSLLTLLRHGIRKIFEKRQKGSADSYWVSHVERQLTNHARQETGPPEPPFEQFHETSSTRFPSRDYHLVGLRRGTLLQRGFSRNAPKVSALRNPWFKASIALFQALRSENLQWRRLYFTVAARAMQEHEGLSFLKSQWPVCELLSQFERGHTAPAEASKGALGRSVSAREIQEHFTAAVAMTMASRMHSAEVEAARAALAAESGAVLPSEAFFMASQRWLVPHCS